MSTKLKILILIKEFDKKFPKHKPKMDMITAIERYADVCYWGQDGHLPSILKKVPFQPDFIFHYDLGGYEAKLLAPAVTGLSQTTIAKGCFVIDVHTEKKLREKYFRESGMDLIFSAGKSAFLKGFPLLKEKFRWLPWSINPKVFYDRKKKKEMTFLLMGLVHGPHQYKGLTPARVPKGKYLFREIVLDKMRNKPGFVYIPHPGHFTSDKNACVNEKYAIQMNKAHIFFTCGGNVPNLGPYPVLKFFEAPACKTLLLAKPNPDIRELGFIDGVNYVACDRTNVVQKALYYMKNRKERELLTEAGYQFIHEKHTNDVRAKQFVNMVEDFLSKREKIIVKEVKIPDTRLATEKKENDVIFVTAAYGEKYRRYVKGLAATMTKNNQEKLIVYTDTNHYSLPGCQVNQNVSLNDIYKKYGDISSWSIRMFLLAHAAKNASHVCWIDADMLVYTNLKSKLDVKKMNVIGYECRRNLQAQQRYNCMNGCYSLPRQFLLELEDLWYTLCKDPKTTKNDIGNVSILNQFVSRHESKTTYLNETYPGSVWNYTPFQNLNRPHKPNDPSLNNRSFCTGLMVKNDHLYHRHVPFATLCWTSHALEQHIKNNFRNISDIRTRGYLRKLYL